MQPTLKQRKSGIIVPADSVPDEDCRHLDVERLKSNYRCRKCKQKVYLVTVETKFMTPKEIGEWQKERRNEQA